jgi:hypothetical protein
MAKMEVIKMNEAKSLILLIISNSSIHLLHDSDGGYKNDWNWKYIMDNCDRGTSCFGRVEFALMVNMSTIMKQTKRSLEVVVAANQIDFRTSKLNC